MFFRSLVCFVLVPLCLLLLSCGDEGLGDRHYKFAVGDNVDYNCSTATFSSSYLEVMNAYDDYFNSRRPTRASDFAFEENPEILSKEIVETVRFNGLPDGLDKQTYHDHFDFDPGKFSRRTDKTNLAIFRGLNLSDKYAPFKNYNPLDYVPTTATYYSRTEGRDRMAEQFWFRMKCEKNKYEAIMAEHPDIVDVITPLSCNEVGGVFDIRFAKVEDGQMLISKPFKILGVDCSGDMRAHGTEGVIYRFGMLDGEAIMSDRRFEISGWMYQKLNELGVAGSVKPLLAKVWQDNPPELNEETDPVEPDQIEPDPNEEDPVVDEPDQPTDPDEIENLPVDHNRLPPDDGLSPISVQIDTQTSSGSDQPTDRQPAREQATPQPPVQGTVTNSGVNSQNPTYPVDQQENQSEENVAVGGCGLVRAHGSGNVEGDGR